MVATKVRQPRSAGGKFGVIEGTAEFESYFARTQQHYEGKVAQAFHSPTPPANWPWSTQAREHYRQKILEYPRVEAQMEWIANIAIRGYTPHELAAGELASGSKTGIDGVVIRPPASDLEPATRQEARRLMNTVISQKIPLDSLVLARLEQVARGHGEDRPTVHFLRGVRAEVASAEAQKQAAVRAVEVLTRILVRVPFSAMGESWTVGEHAVTAETLASLEDWKAKMEAQATLHDWDFPSGFSMWPPYEILSSKSRAAAKVVATAPW
jgi:hypothetical protein